MHDQAMIPTWMHEVWAGFYTSQDFFRCIDGWARKYADGKGVVLDLQRGDCCNFSVPEAVTYGMRVDLKSGPVEVLRQSHDLRLQGVDGTEKASVCPFAYERRDREPDH